LKKPLTESLFARPSSSMVPITALIGRTASRYLEIIPDYVETTIQIIE